MKAVSSPSGVLGRQAMTSRGAGRQSGRVKSVEARLGGFGKALSPPSGTESVIMHVVMVEGEDEPLINFTAQKRAESAASALG